MLDSNKIRELKKDERKNTEEEKREVSKVRKVVSVILIQLIIAFILVAVLYFLKIFNVDYFNQIKNYYNSSEYFLIKEEEGIVIIE